MARKLCDQYVNFGGTKGTFWNARDALVESGEVVCDGKPMIMHLIKKDPANNQPF